MAFRNIDTFGTIDALVNYLRNNGTKTLKEIEGIDNFKTKVDRLAVMSNQFKWRRYVICR
jgi:hypothetical protein